MNHIPLPEHRTYGILRGFPGTSIIDARKPSGVYRSGQTGQIVNLMALPSQVRILSRPIIPFAIQRKALQIADLHDYEARQFPPISAPFRWLLCRILCRFFCGARRMCFRPSRLVVWPVHCGVPSGRLRCRLCCIFSSSSLPNWKFLVHFNCNC